MPTDPQMPGVRRRGLVATLVLLAIAAVGVAAHGLTTRAEQFDRLKARAQAQAVPTVTVAPPGPAGAVATLALPARIEAFARAPIHARVSGYVKHWHADIGTRVRAGQLLAEIETPELDQQLAQARAELANAKAAAAMSATTARRWQALASTDAVSRQEADEKAADLVARQSAVAALQANVDRFVATREFARIVAPFDGVVTARSIDVGALVNVGSAQGTELFVVSDTRRLRVYVNVPQNQVGAVRIGAKASLTVPENPGKRYTATVQSTAQAINATLGAMLVQLTVDNAGSELLPGGFATVGFEMRAAAGTVTIPPGALIFDKSGLRVATVDGQDRVALKRVTISRDLGTAVEIGSGLDAQDRVIQSPPDGIGDGDPVKVAQATPATGGRAGGSK